MKLGFTQVYNEKEWIGYAIDQAMRICDKLLIVEGSRFMCLDDYPVRSDDGTLDIISDKMRKYPNFIEIWPDGSNEGNVKGNWCANYQAALERCKTGDYLIPFDVDTFYLDSCIDNMNEAMRESKVDSMELTGLQFVLSFRWAFEHVKEAFFKRIPGAHFTPMHKPRQFGSHRIIMKNISFLHYSWVKTQERMFRRARIGIYKGMKEWFASNYDKIELAEGSKIHYVKNQIFTIREYKGKHPSVLDNHPWRNAEDIRRLKE